MDGKWIKSAVSGAVTGVANGFFGGGGGLILVPLLKKWVKIEIKIAHATALAVTICLSAASLVPYLMDGRVTFLDAAPFMPGGIVGGIAGAMWLKKIPKKLLKKGFAAFLIFSGVRMVFFE